MLLSYSPLCIFVGVKPLKLFKMSNILPFAYHLGGKPNLGFTSLREAREFLRFLIVRGKTKNLDRDENGCFYIRRFSPNGKIIDYHL